MSNGAPIDVCGIKVTMTELGEDKMCIKGDGCMLLRYGDKSVVLGREWYVGEVHNNRAVLRPMPVME